MLGPYPPLAQTASLVLGGIALIVTLLLLRSRRRKRHCDCAYSALQAEADKARAAIGELRESEARYRALFEGVPVAVLEKDYTEVGLWLDELRRKGVADIIDYLRRNPGLLLEQYGRVKVLSSNRTALQRLDLLEAARAGVAAGPTDVSPHLLGLFQRELEALWNGRSTTTFTLDYPRNDGTLGHALLHWSAPAVENWNERRLGLLVFTDLTELRMAEERILAGEERATANLQGQNAGIWEHNFATGESKLSERWRKMVGYEVQEISDSGEQWLEKIHPDDHAVVQAAMDAHLRGETDFYESEHRMLCSDGSHKWVLSRGQALFDSQGRPSRIIGARADINDRKHAEAALRASEARFREIFENSIEGICETSIDGGFISVNPAFARILGYTDPASLIQDGLSVPENFYVKPGRRDDFFALLGTSDELQGFESEVRRRDGSTVWVSENVRVVRDAEGRILRIHSFVSDISARRAAVDALRLSEQRLRQIVQQADCMLWHARVMDLDGALRYAYHVPVSGLHRRLFGHDPQREETRLWTQEMVPSLADLDRRSNLAIRGGENEYQHEFQVFTGGQVLWLSEKVEITRQSASEWHLVGVVVDVTSRRQAEENLRISEARYRQLMEHSPLAIMELDVSAVAGLIEDLRREGIEDFRSWYLEHRDEIKARQNLTRICTVNNAAAALLRFPSPQEITKLGTAFRPEGLAEARLRVLDSIWAGLYECEGEAGFLAYDGTPLRVLFHWWVPLMEGRPNMSRSQLILVDLSDARRAEQALADERERLSVTLRAMSEAVLTTDINGVVQYINAAAEQLTGWTAESSVGKRLSEVCVLQHARTQERVELPAMIGMEDLRVCDLPPHTGIKARDGALTLVEGRLAALHGANGSVLGAVLVLRDMTERARLEAEQSRSSKLESLGILAGGIAHDFNNLLTVVMGNLTLAMLDSQVMSSAGRWLKEAERGVLRARDLTHQLLTFAKGGDPVKTSVSLADLVRETTEFAMHGAKARHVLEFAHDLWPADVDKTQICQVVQNIVINAVQAMPEGGVLHVSLSNAVIDQGSIPSLSAGRYLKLSIADSGSGIKPEHLARIFDPYFTTKASGSGLGLATVYSIIKKHQGHIDVDSKIGRGTTFHIWLPAAKRNPNLDAQVKTGGLFRPARILFMDDEEPIRRLGQALLQSLGYDTRIVADGTAALREYELARRAQRPFDLVMLDLTVPGGMGGLSTLEALRKMDPCVKAIVTSGYSSDPVLGEYQQHGFLGVVPKPYRIADLGRTVQSVLAGLEP